MDWAGSIPACAGEPGQAVGICWRAAVYPRVCGGTTAGVPAHHTGAGLSPRVRGNLAAAAARYARRRSIPACAGEPRIPQRPRESPEVYPRVCGGTFVAVGTWAGVEGLSPRVRGNPLTAEGEEVGHRSIPACAGEPCGAYRRG